MKRLIILFYFAILLFLSIVFYLKPQYNWDMLPYMDLSMESNSTDIKAIHSDVYRIAKAELPHDKFTALIDSSNYYRHSTATDTEVFQHELSFYKTRPLYVWMISAFHRAGIPLTKATILPSVLAFFLIGLLIYFWPASKTHPPGPPLLKKRAGGDYWNLAYLIFSLLIMVSPFIGDTARLSTPDLITAFFLLAGVWVLVEFRSVFGASLPFFLAMLTRYDCILFVILILAWHIITERKRFLSWLPLAGGMILITILQFGEILFILRHVFFIMSASKRLTYSIGGNIFYDYGKSLAQGLPSFFHSQVALISIILLATIIHQRRVLHTGWKDPFILLPIFGYAYIPLRFIFHPDRKSVV